MSTVQEIESAIGQLPREKMREIQQWLEKTLGGGPRPDGYFADDYAAMDEERIKVEEWSLKVPQSAER
jgi:hypothetical protein